MTMNLKRVGEIGLALAVLVCLVGGAAVAETPVTEDPVGKFLTTYGMPGGVIGLLGWFVRHVAVSVDRRMDQIVSAITQLGVDHKDAIGQLVTRNAELEQRVFDAVVAHSHETDGTPPPPRRQTSKKV